MSENKKGKFQVLTPLEHLLARPGMYIGSINLEDYDQVVPTKNGPVHLKTQMAPGLLKIIDEALANASDASLTDPNAKNIKVTTNHHDNSITVESETLFPIEFIVEYNKYSVELAVSRLLTGSNFNDDDNGFQLGQHGVGIKATNAYSDYFEFVVTDPSTGLIYKGIWMNNMSRLVESVVKKTKNKKPSVKVTFIPDLKRFNLPKKLSAEQWQLIESMVFNLAATVPQNVNVYLNDDKIPFKGLTGFMKSVMGDAIEKIATDSVIVDGNTVFEIGVSLARSDMTSVAFVNGAPTRRGTLIDMIYRKIAAALSKKTNISSTLIRNNIYIAAKALIRNARFIGQTKEELYTPVGEYGFTWNPSDKFIQSLGKIGVTEMVKNLLKGKEDLKAAKDLGKKSKGKIPQIVKYDPATKLFKVHAELIITEGDSAKALAVAGRASMPDGVQKLGIYPVRGKLINPENFALAKVAQNQEVKELLDILNLVPFQKYTVESVKKLPYRNIILFTDQDTDGSHIAGLAINLLMYLVPTLFDIWPDFVKRFSSPILRIMSGQFSGTSFKTEQDFKEFAAQHPSVKNAKLKYYKGLGTSTDEDAAVYFAEFDKNVMVVNHNGQPAKDAIKLAFGKENADQRKDYLSKDYDENAVIDYNKSKITIPTFVFDDLMHFSNYDNERSIPKMIDGLKPSQRKVLYWMMENTKTNEVKVSIIASQTAQSTQYRHGEVSLAGVVTNMAATYTGKGIMLLEPRGQFGTRMNPTPAASRYIYSKCNPLTYKLFRPEDNKILKSAVIENVKVEPVNYVPVIPFVLLNGSDGIGTGWRSLSWNYNPLDVIAQCRQIARGTKLDDKVTMVPYYIGYTGTFEQDEKGFVNIGKYEVGKGYITVTELPIGVPTDSWMESLQSLIPDTITSMEKNNTKNTVNTKLFLAKEVADPVSTFKLRKHLPTTGMYLFDNNNRIKKYTTTTQIINEHSIVRLKTYEISRIAQIQEQELNKSKLLNKVKYIEYVLTEKIKFKGLSSDGLKKYLADQNFDKFDNSYDYLIRMETLQLTTDKVEQLKKQVMDIEKLIQKLNEMTPQTMWLDDLKELEGELVSYMNDRLSPDVNPKKRKK